MNDVKAPVVLVLAGLDPSGGAGLAADIEALTAQSCIAAPVATALTVQNTTGVTAVSEVDTVLVEQQARAVIEDMPIAAIKTGLLASQANVELAARLASDTGAPLVVDPVFASGDGKPLSSKPLDRVYLQTLLPLCTLATPNTVETSELGHADNIDQQARRILDTGCQWLLVTGTHDPTYDIAHRLYHEGQLYKTFRQPRLPGDYHGSGCTLASACAAGIAHGLAMDVVVTKALAYTQATLENALKPGHGQWLPNRLP
ncbi:MAG: hydroxymethylpyrimidine/phosphomethylpyrimidine kinase [Acidiferrobacterales bacterium]|nr:hydroxymethylpyrimidine/phosphomethylpyrimidine kinase [Acidiferrobacterales bacterium]